MFEVYIHEISPSTKTLKFSFRFIQLLQVNISTNNITADNPFKMKLYTKHILELIQGLAEH